MRALNTTLLLYCPVEEAYRAYRCSYLSLCIPIVPATSTRDEPDLAPVLFSAAIRIRSLRPTTCQRHPRRNVQWLRLTLDESACCWIVALNASLNEWNCITLVLSILWQPGSPHTRNSGTNKYVASQTF